MLLAVLAWAATVLSVAMFAAGLSTVQRIRREGTTGAYSVVPFVSTFANCILARGARARSCGRSPQRPGSSPPRLPPGGSG